MSIEIRPHTEPIPFFTCDEPGCTNDIAVICEGGEWEYPGQDLQWAAAWASEGGVGWCFGFDRGVDQHGRSWPDWHALCPGHNPDGVWISDKGDESTPVADPTPMPGSDKGLEDEPPHLAVSGLTPIASIYQCREKEGWVVCPTNQGIPFRVAPSRLHPDLRYIDSAWGHDSGYMLVGLTDEQALSWIRLVLTDQFGPEERRYNYDPSTTPDKGTTASPRQKSAR